MTSQQRREGGRGGENTRKSAEYFHYSGGVVGGRGAGSFKRHRVRRVAAQREAF